MNRVVETLKTCMERAYGLLKACVFGSVVSALLFALWMLVGTVFGTAAAPSDPLTYLKALAAMTAIGLGVGLMGTLLFGFPILLVLAAIGVRGKFSFVFWGVLFGSLVGLAYGSLLNSPEFILHCVLIGAVTGWLAGRYLPIQSTVTSD